MKKWVIFGSVLVLVVVGIIFTVYQYGGGFKRGLVPDTKLEIQLGFDTDGRPVWGWNTVPETIIWHS